MVLEISRRTKLKRIGGYLLAYVDAIAAALLAGIVLTAATIGDLKGDDLTAANVGVVLAVAFVLLRDRWERQQGLTALKLAVGQERREALVEFESTIRSEREQCVDGVQRALAELHAPSAWNILEEQMSWDLHDPDGRRAKAIAHKVFLFTQDQVFCVYEYQIPTVGRAKVIGHRCFGGEHEPLDELPIIQSDFPGPAGRTYRLISLQRVWRRGETMIFRSERDLQDTFLQASEHVSKEVSAATSQLTMRVTWPSSRPPRSVYLERSDRPRETIDINSLAVRNGRHALVKTVSDPVVGERILVAWTW